MIWKITIADIAANTYRLKADTMGQRIAKTKSLKKSIVTVSVISIQKVLGVCSYNTTSIYLHRIYPLSVYTPIAVFHKTYYHQRIYEPAYTSLHIRAVYTISVYTTIYTDGRYYTPPRTTTHTTPYTSAIHSLYLP